MMKRTITLFLSVIISILSFSQKVIQYEKEMYNVGISYEKGEFSVLTKDMILLNIEYSYLTTIDEANIPFIHNKYGPNYIKYYCTSLVRSLMRENFSSYTLEEILFSKRELITDNISNELSETLYEDTILFKKLLIESIILPPSLQAALEKVANTKQEVIVQRNILERTKIEDEIQSVKNKMDAKYNQMLDSSLTEKILQMKYIDVLSKLTESPNTKIIVLGNDKLDLPTILDE